MNLALVKVRLCVVASNVSYGLTVNMSPNKRNISDHHVSANMDTSDTIRNAESLAPRLRFTHGLPSQV